jgi:hypothetical protein
MVKPDEGITSPKYMYSPDQSDLFRHLDEWLLVHADPTIFSLEQYIVFVKP